MLKNQRPRPATISPFTFPNSWAWLCLSGYTQGYVIAVGNRCRLDHLTRLFRQVEPTHRILKSFVEHPGESLFPALQILCEACRSTYILRREKSNKIVPVGRREPHVRGRLHQRFFCGRLEVGI